MTSRQPCRKCGTYSCEGTICQTCLEKQGHPAHSGTVCDREGPHYKGNIEYDDEAEEIRTTRSGSLARIAASITTDDNAQRVTDGGEDQRECPYCGNSIKRLPDHLAKHCEEIQ